MPVFPAGIPAIPDDGSWTHEQVAAEVAAIASTAGVNPQGSKATVADRVAAQNFGIVPGAPQADWFLRPLGNTGNATQAANSQGRMGLSPVYNPVPFPLSRFHFQCMTAGVGEETTGQPVLYSSTSTGLPHLLLATGAVMPLTATGVFYVPPSAPVTVPAGLLWVGLILKYGTTAAGMRCHVSAGAIPVAGFFQGTLAETTSYQGGLFTNLGINGIPPEVAPNMSGARQTAVVWLGS